MGFDRMFAEAKPIRYLFVRIALTNAFYDLFLAISHTAYLGGVRAQSPVVKEGFNGIVIDPDLPLVDHVEGFFEETELRVGREHSVYFVGEKSRNDTLFLDTRVDEQHFGTWVTCEKTLIDGRDVHEDDVGDETVGERFTAHHNVFVIVVDQQMINSFGDKVVAEMNQDIHEKSPFLYYEPVVCA